MKADSINDIELLREYTRQVELELTRVYSRMAELTREIAELKGSSESAQLKMELKVLQEQLDKRNQMLFGQSSEKRAKGDDTTGASDGNKDDDNNEKKKRRGHGPTEQPELPRVEQLHLLDEADLVCPKCGGMLHPVDGMHEEHEEIHRIERVFVIRVHKKQKYVCDCGECVETALGPERLVPGGRYSNEVAVGVAIDKYADHIPLARQERIMARHGVKVSRQTLWDLLLALAMALKPTYDAIREYILSQPVIGADETTWKLMGKNGSKSWFVWAIGCEDAVWYDLHPSRAGEVAAGIFGDYGGIVMVDGYPGYPKARALAEERNDRDGPTFTLVSCWAHARRGFVDCCKNYPEANDVLELIAELYLVEQEAKQHKGEDGFVEHVAALRRERSKPIVDKIKAWLMATAPKYLESSSMGKAVAYALNRWNELTMYIDDPAIPIDNLAIERAMRGVALGRKNHYGSRSKRGTEVAAIFYTLIESAKAAGIEPHAYLTTATQQAVHEPGIVTMPHQLVKEQAQP